MDTIALAFLGTTELIIILVIVVLVFGLGKLPEVGKQLGAGIKNFKKEVDDGSTPPEQLDSDESSEVESKPRDVTHENRSEV